MIGGVVRYIDGIDLCEGIAYKKNDTEIDAGSIMYVATGNSSDTPVAGVMAVVVTGALSACCVEVTGHLSSANRYNISGTCVPGAATVYASAGYKTSDSVYLRQNIMAITNSDEDGNFSFTGIQGPDDKITIWLSTDVEYLDVVSINNISITLYSEPITPPTPGEGSGSGDGSGSGSGDGDDEVETPTVQVRVIYDSFVATDTAWVTCISCGGDPILKTGDPCRQCGGEKEYVSGQINCTTCGGDGRLDDTTECTCNDGKVDVTSDCTLCDENGLYKEFVCEDCNGTGYLSDGSECSCTNGKVFSKTCDVCGGTGKTAVVYSNVGARISGHVPTDATTVAVISANDDAEITEEYLRSAGVIISTSVISGEFSAELSVTKGNKYVMWTETTDPEGEFYDVSVVAIDGKNVCLSGDTLITMSDGSRKRLDSLKIGDSVISQDGNITTIAMLKRGNYSKSHTLYYFEDGTIIDEMHKHRFYNADQGFWQCLEAWNIGEHAINQNGEYIALISKEIVRETAEQFGLWTEDGSYYANGLLSGSADCNKRLLAGVTAEQAVDMMLSVDGQELLKLMGIEGELP